MKRVLPLLAIVLDADGRVRFQYSGRLPDEKVGQFYETLGALIGVDLTN